MSSIFKPRQFFSSSEKERIVHAIHEAELETSGEIRVFVENKNPMVDPVDRARQVFHKLKMEHTRQRNAVLLYVAVKHHELALYGDQGVHQEVGETYWKAALQKVIGHLKENDLAGGIVKSIHLIGQALKEKFPYNAKTDENELPGDIVFGE